MTNTDPRHSNPNNYWIKTLVEMQFHGRTLKAGDSLRINPDIPVSDKTPSYGGLAVVGTAQMM
jgi:hypothetical protein